MSGEEVEQLRSILNEFQAANKALDILETTWAVLHVRIDPTITTLDHVQNALENLEATYIVRIFAEFETILRNTPRPQRFRGRQLPTRTRDLITRVASDQSIPDITRDKADNVRRLRNAIVHDSSEPYEIVTIEEALRYLSRFVAKLP
jgi:hypothetical protein